MGPASTTYQELRRTGFSRGDIRTALAAGRLVRSRRGRYADASIGDVFLRAAAHGGRVDCRSLLRQLGVFVLEDPRLHLQVDREASRLPEAARDVVRHWRDSAVPVDDLAADIVEALAQAVRCQSPRAAIASLDSAWHRGFVDEQGIADVFAMLPARYQVLRTHLDPRSEAGSETLVRLMVRGLGRHVDLQVRIRGVGRVDLVVDGWLIIECDSRAHHSDVAQQVKDRRRDLAAARLGFVTFRVLSEDVHHQPEAVLEAIRALLDRFSR